jgi:hypothetical protein
VAVAIAIAAAAAAKRFALMSHLTFRTLAKMGKKVEKVDILSCTIKCPLFAFFQKTTIKRTYDQMANHDQMSRCHLL